MDINQSNDELQPLSIMEKYFPRFVRLIEFNFDLAVLLLKNWLTTNNENSSRALQAIGQNLEEEQFNQFFNKLTSNERQKWKDIIKGHLGVSDLKMASSFISEEVTREMMSNSANYDIELFDLISRYSIENIVLFLQNHTSQTGALFNTLPPSILAKVLGELPKDEAAKYIEESFLTSVTKGDPAYNKLKQALTDFILQIENKPFTSKLLEMLPSFNPLREKVIYNSIIGTISNQDLIEVASKNFPYELFTKLPVEVIKESLKSYPEASRVNFLACLSDEDKSFYLDALAAKGTPLRDMVELSLQEIEGNPTRLSGVKQSSSEYTKHFIKHLRAHIVGTPALSPIIHDILETWIKAKAPSGDNVLKFK